MTAKYLLCISVTHHIWYTIKEKKANLEDAETIVIVITSVIINGTKLLMKNNYACVAVMLLTHYCSN